MPRISLSASSVFLFAFEAVADVALVADLTGDSDEEVERRYLGGLPNLMLNRQNVPQTEVNRPGRGGQFDRENKENQPPREE